MDIAAMSCAKEPFGIDMGSAFDTLRDDFDKIVADCKRGDVRFSALECFNSLMPPVYESLAICRDNLIKMGYGEWF